MADGRRPDDDTRCPTCGGSAHALDAVARPKFGGREYTPRDARKALDRAWDESDRMASEIDSTYAHLRAVIENAKTMPAEAIRHQLVGLLPEVQSASDELREKFPALAERLDTGARAAWAEYGNHTDRRYIEAVVTDEMIELAALALRDMHAVARITPPFEVQARRVLHAALEGRGGSHG
ncbi:MAG TPA: hypothetical protein VK595_11150 [Vicinamibacterales bacterium]|nr:hypothetical protein [Vicinamibacterales bacterium]